MGGGNAARPSNVSKGKGEPDKADMGDLLKEHDSKLGPKPSTLDYYRRKFGLPTDRSSGGRSDPGQEELKAQAWEEYSDPELNRDWRPDLARIRGRVRSGSSPGDGDGDSEDDEGSDMDEVGDGDGNDSNGNGTDGNGADGDHEFQGEDTDEKIEEKVLRKYLRQW
jgi:hypothetical protein